MRAKLLLIALLGSACFNLNAQLLNVSDSSVKSKKYLIKKGELFSEVTRKMGNLRTDNFRPGKENTYYSGLNDEMEWDNHLISKTIILKFDKTQKLSSFKIIYTVQISLSNKEMLRFVREKIDGKEINCANFLQNNKMKYLLKKSGITHEWSIYSTQAYSRFYYYLY